MRFNSPWLMTTLLQSTRDGQTVSSLVCKRTVDLWHMGEAIWDIRVFYATEDEL